MDSEELERLIQSEVDRREVRRLAAERQQAKDSTNQLLTEILAVLQHIGSADKSGAVSSVKLTLQRGTVDIAVHAYVGSDIAEAEMEALASYRRVLESLNQSGVDAFEKTLAAVKR